MTVDAQDTAAIPAQYISQCGPAAKQFVSSPPRKADIVGMPETHTYVEGLNGVYKFWDSRGWKAVATPSRTTNRTVKAGVWSRG